jgi:hypothetical protein
LILQHQAAVLAIAEALMVERTQNGGQVDAIISAAPERARRADWAKVLENATGHAVMASAIGGKADTAKSGGIAAV